VSLQDHRRIRVEKHEPSAIVINGRGGKLPRQTPDSGDELRVRIRGQCLLVGPVAARGYKPAAIWAEGEYSHGPIAFGEREARVRRIGCLQVGESRVGPFAPCREPPTIRAERDLVISLLKIF
jgi:hypothetical protein